jgi:hypothetical protein
VGSVTAGATEIWRDRLDAHQRRMLEEMTPGSIVYLDSIIGHFHSFVKLQ